MRWPYCTCSYDGRCPLAAVGAPRPRRSRSARKLDARASFFSRQISCRIGCKPNLPSAEPHPVFVPIRPQHKHIGLPCCFTENLGFTCSIQWPSPTRAPRRGSVAGRPPPALAPPSCACGAGACCPVVATASKVNAATFLAFVFVSGEPDRHAAAHGSHGRLLPATRQAEKKVHPKGNQC